MPVKVPTPTQAQVNELRQRFLEKYEKTPPPAQFHPVDLDRVKNADLWCTRFLEMYDLDVDVCLDKLWETCTWRQQYGANDLNENNLRKDYLTNGNCFVRNKDIDGKPLLIFKCKLHTKGSKDMDEVMRVVVYWIERTHRETNMNQLTVFFDMDGTGMSNMDLDFVKRIIETFKLYYPNSLNYILVYELAWVLNAVFNVVKGLLPAKALEILKMIKKKEINTYIDKANCLKCWGGDDDYAFSFVPEKKLEVRQSVDTTPTLKVNGTASPTLFNDDQNNNNNNNNNNNKNNNGSPDKKVHFANSSPVRWPKDTETEDYQMQRDHNMLHISPSEFLTFSQGENSDAFIEVTCMSKTPVMFKIQTTSPEKFRVRPRCGVLKSNQTVSVNILLKAEHRLGDTSKDKFLVMCMPAPMEMDLSTPQQVAEVWRQRHANNPDIEQHRLCCIYKNSEQMLRNGFSGNGQFREAAAEINSPKSSDSIIELAKHAKKLEKQLKFTQLLQYLTLFVLLIMSVAVVYLLRLEMGSDTLQSSSNTPTIPIAAAEIGRGSIRSRFSEKMGRFSRGSSK